MSHYIYIKCQTNNPKRLLLKLYKNRINVLDVKKSKDYVILKVSINDYEKIKKELVTLKFSYVTDSGIYKIKSSITPLKIFSLILFVLAINFFSRIIVSVEVIHSNKEIREMVKKSLDNEGIHLWSFKKDYNELQNIKNKILSNHKDNLEWLEIESMGMHYVIRVEERIQKNYEQTEGMCHIYAKKSGIVDASFSTRGEILVHEGQYVNEGDILISGEIALNEEVKNDVCASGTVLAEVWYESHVSLPINYTTSTRTGKKRFNISFLSDTGKYKLFRSRLKDFETESQPIFHFFNFTFYLDKEYEVIKTPGKYDLDSGTKKALNLSLEKISVNLKDFEKIKVQKVLKNTINDSTIEVDVFYAIIEDIGIQKKYTKTIEEEGS